MLSYEIPESLNLSEAEKNVLEIVDEMLAERFDVHFLEPRVSYETTVKVRPLIKKQSNQERDPLSYMKGLEKKARLEYLEHVRPLQLNPSARIGGGLRPRLSADLKVEVAKFPAAERTHAQEVAEVLEEIMQSASEGRLTLQS